MDTAPAPAATEPEPRPRRVVAAARGTRRAAGVVGAWVVSKVPELVLESVLIVFSIVLGLWVNERIQERSDRETKLQSLILFENEIRGNRQLLETGLPSRESLGSALAKMDSAGELRTADEFYELVGSQPFRPPPLATTAWETAIATGTLRQLDDFETVRALSLVYTQQAQYERMSEGSMPEFLRTGVAPPGQTRRMVNATIRYLNVETQAEQELSAIYEQTLHSIAVARRRLGG